MPKVTLLCISYAGRVIIDSQSSEEKAEANGSISMP
jgi:hypothetical protein